MEKQDLINFIKVIPYIILVCLTPYAAVFLTLEICEWFNVHPDTAAFLSLLIGTLLVLALIIICVVDLIAILKSNRK